MEWGLLPDIPGPLQLQTREQLPCLLPVCALLEFTGGLERENSHFTENVFYTISRSLPEEPLKWKPRLISVKDFPRTDRLADAATSLALH